MMKTLKRLINIKCCEEIEEYKKIGITNFLIFIPEFSIAYPTIPIEDAPDEVFVYVNRIMDTNTVTNFKKIIPQLKRFRGIIFEDLGVFHLLKDEKIPLIWAQNHFVTNKESLNYYLESGCLSAIISNELHKEEIKEMFSSSLKPLVFTVFGKNNVMYSRRKLLSNFNEHAGLDEMNDVVLETKRGSFFAHEEENGTLLFAHEYFNYLEFSEEIPDEKVLYYLILNLEFSVQEIGEILDGKEVGNRGFLEKKTVYKMAEYDDKK